MEISEYQYQIFDLVRQIMIDFKQAHLLDYYGYKNKIAKISKSLNTSNLTENEIAECSEVLRQSEDILDKSRTDNDLSALNDRIIMLERLIRWRWKKIQDEIWRNIEN